METKLRKIKKLLASGESDEAFALLRELKANMSDEEAARDIWRVHELFGACFHDFGDAEGAAAAYFNAAESDRFLSAQRQHFSNYLFALHYLPNVSNEELAAQHFAYEKFYDGEKTFAPREKTGAKIRVGCLAPNFCEQAAARFYEVLLTHENADEFEVFCYALDDDEDDFSRRMKKSVSAWCILPHAPRDAAEKIYADKIDVLFDLAGHSAGGRTLMITAQRPARVQLCGIGYFDTTGLRAVDFMLGDDVLFRAGDESCFAEKPLCLRHAFCFLPTEKLRRFSRRPRKKNAPVVFASFNNFMKITDETLALWRDILAATPDARLVLQDTTPLPARKREMLKRVSAAGFSPERVEVRLARENFVEDYNEIDIILDTFPYNGGAMTAAAIYSGVPVVTLAGKRYGARFGASILKSANLSELVAETADEYAAKAIALAGDEARLSAMQLSLRETVEASPLTDLSAYMKDIEAACKKILGAGNEMKR